jgi:hypothetical protein
VRLKSQVHGISANGRARLQFRVRFRRIFARSGENVGPWDSIAAKKFPDI